jgi:hypothetical protein
MRWALNTLIGTVLLVGTTAHAQNTLTVAVTSPLPTFQLTGGPTTASNLTIQTYWSLNSCWFLCTANIYVCVYMDADMSGTGVNTDTIPFSSVQINPNNSGWSSIRTSNTACGVVGATQVGPTSKFVWVNVNSGSVSSTVPVRIAGYPVDLMPDTYTGTITVIANAQY